MDIKKTLKFASSLFILVHSDLQSECLEYKDF